MRIERIEQPQDLEHFVAQDLVQLAKQKEGTLHIALPGGRSAQFIVKGLLAVQPSILSRVHLYLVDERLEGEKNLETLLAAGLDRAVALTQLSIPRAQRELSTSPFDRVYLSVGEDGHIASLFPGRQPEQDTVQVAVVEQSSKPPKRRATLTYYGFSKLARNATVFLLFLGEGKRDALERLMSGKEHAGTLPCAYFVDNQFTNRIITDLKE